MKAYKVVFTTIASRDIAEIWDYHESVMSKDNADKVVDGILETADSLETMPYKFRSLGHEDYRCVPSGVYLLVYRIFEEESVVFIETVFDNRQDPMRLMELLQ